MRIAADQPRGIEQVSDPDLMHRQPLAHRVPDRLAVEPHQRAGRGLRRHCIDQYGVARLCQLIEQRKAERTAVDQTHPGTEAILALEPREHQRPYRIIAEQHIAQTEDENRHAALAGCCVQGFTGGLRGMNLNPDKIESKIPVRSIVE